MELNEHDLIFCMGQSCSGKTHYAKRFSLTRPEFEYVNFDTCWNYNVNNNKATKDFLNKLLPKISKGHVITDGLNNPLQMIKSIKKRFPEISIKIIYLIVEPEKLCLKQKETGVEVIRSLKDIEKTSVFHRKLLRGVEELVMFVHNDYGTYVLSEYTLDEVIINLKKFFDLDKFLKGLETYANVKILQEWHGKDPYTPHTYKMLDENINFKNKSVLDIGCHYGTYCLLAEEKGAKMVVGLDVSKDVILKAERINQLNDSNIKFLWGDIEEYDKERLGKYDIILLLNVLHHNKYPERTLNLCFSITKELVLEVEMPNKDRIKKFPDFKFLSLEEFKKIADRHGFKLKKELPSKRPHRKILLYKKNV